MRIFAYCTLAARKPVWKAVGVEPLTSPPMVAGRFKPAYLEWYDLLYFRLHGGGAMPGVWFGEDKAGNRYDALNLGHVRGAALRGAAVVVANCHGADDPMVGAFYESGASFVVAGHGPNYAAGNRVVGADLLVKWLVLAMKAGAGVERALQLAKMRLMATSWRKTDRDTLAFKVITQEA